MQRDAGFRHGSEREYDVVVIGGGAAGLAAAATLGRARRSVLVIDAGQPRNARADSVHTYLGREGTPPGDLLASGRAEVADYGGGVLDGTVVKGERGGLENGLLRVVLDTGACVYGRRVLVTTGLVDELPDIPGVAELWGKDVLYCPYCHGWEVRDQTIGILATGPVAVFQALVWRQWTASISLLLHTAPEPQGAELKMLAARGISVVEGEVVNLTTEDRNLSGVQLADGRIISMRALVVAPQFEARVDALSTLNPETAEQEMVGHVIGKRLVVDQAGQTSIPGVWAAGNVVDVTENVIGSSAAGVHAAIAINSSLIEEDTGVAVAALNDPFSPAMEREVCERVT